jgi:hypothetical protein
LGQFCKVGQGRGGNARQVDDRWGGDILVNAL